MLIVILFFILQASQRLLIHAIVLKISKHIEQYKTGIYSCDVVNDDKIST